MHDVREVNPGANALLETHPVRVLNQSPAGSGERIGRLVNVEGTPLLRKATLTLLPDSVRLWLVDDLGCEHDLGSMTMDEIDHVGLARGAFTPGQQLVRPVVTGMLGGLVGGVILLARMGSSNVRSPGASLAMIPLLGLFFAAVLVLLNIRSITWSPLALLVFTARDGRTMDFAVTDAEVERLLSSLLGRGIAVRPLRKAVADATSPDVGRASPASTDDAGEDSGQTVEAVTRPAISAAYWTCPECGSRIAGGFSRCAGCHYLRA